MPGTKRPVTEGRPPAEGERAARRGYRHQDKASARLVYDALLARRLRWVGLADRAAGDVDDLVLGLEDGIVAHQFKRSQNPSGFGLKGLLLGKEGEIGNLAASHGKLFCESAGTPVRIRYFTNDYPSTNDRLLSGDRTSTTAAFVAEWSSHPRRLLAEWRSTRWAPVMADLIAASGLSDPAFEAFWMQLELVSGAAASLSFEPGADADRERQVEELSRTIATLVADNPDRDRWSRAELLVEAGWPDRFALRFAHDFPIGAWIQSNRVTEARLSEVLQKARQGYVGLVGVPGSGKSTLLARFTHDGPGVRVARYLAFVPGTAQGQGRGEADAFYHDLSAQLASLGLGADRLKDHGTDARRGHFEALLLRAGRRFQAEGIRTVIVVDGLDHVPREESAARPFLTALPLPHAIPDGVVFVLGTQRLDLPGMPPSVVDQAGAADRLIAVAPLSDAAVAAMADAAGLDPGVDRADLVRVGGGHPLVTRYLVQRLLLADAEQRGRILDGEFGEGGDLEAVYAAAWRSISRARSPLEVRKVLALVAHSQGPIEPDLLALATSDDAVEAALEATRHLLRVSTAGWSVFHNSFRLFVQQQPVERFGTPDPDFSAPGVYRRLRALVDRASRSSTQRWLSFRYAFLAGEVNDALAIATRAYFVGQYVGGRDRSAVVGDIADAYTLVEARPDPAKLFELMLAHDEVARRSSVMESASPLIDAYLALGDVDAAKALLDESFEEGKQWLVVDALLADGRAEEARTLFEGHGPFRELDDGMRMGLVGEFEDRLGPWVRRAVLFLDAGQIDAEVARIVAGAEESLREEFRSTAATEVARAFMVAEPGSDLDALCTRWRVAPTDQRLMIAIDAAEAARSRGDDARAAELLDWISHNPGLPDLHASWSLSAAWVASDIGAVPLAGRLLGNVEIRGLGGERFRTSSQLEEDCHTLIEGVALRTALGLGVVAPIRPGDRLLAGVQHHAIAIATLVGEIRAGRAVSGSQVVQVATSALAFLAGARHAPGEDVLTVHVVQALGRVLLDLLYDLCSLARLPGLTVASIVESGIAGGAVFRHWPDFRRADALRSFELDGDADVAVAMLERALADLECADPRSEVEEVSRFAEAFAALRRPQRARELVAGLRRGAFGAFLPAKKDPQYEMWVDMLALANDADPAGRGRRSLVALHFVEGLETTEGYDMARRMVRQVLRECAAGDPAIALLSFDWAMGKGSVSWDGAVDATLRGFVARTPARSREALAIWSALCLPWYAEPHGSTVELGSFLTELVAGAPPHDLESLEAEAARAIETIAIPKRRARLLRVLASAAAKRGGGEAARAALARVASVLSGNEAAEPDDRSYGHLLTLPQVAEAIESERDHHRRRRARQAHAQEELEEGVGTEVAVEMGGEDDAPGWNLLLATVRVIGASTWDEVEGFARAHPAVVADHRVALAAAKVALAAGRRAAAETLLAGAARRDRSGWSWPSDGGTFRHHEGRHLLGETNAHRDALRDFIRDLTENRHGVSGMLWSVDRIFPLLFPVVPWPALWGLLEEQFRTTRDFARGELLGRDGTGLPQPPPSDDDPYLARLLAEACSMELVPLRDAGARAACDALALGGVEAFALAVERLLTPERDAAVAADLLLRAGDDSKLRERFSHRLAEFAGGDDVALVAAASFLASRWEVPLEDAGRPLPVFYLLDLPASDGPGASGLRDESTGGIVVADALAWTEGWARDVVRIAREAHVSVAHVRRRVAQLIDGWGGITRFGHAGSVVLEERLGRLQMKLAYLRPQATVTVRALRHVVAELFHAGRIGVRGLRAILPSLSADPTQPAGPPPSSRPTDVPMPPAPNLWSAEERGSWLDAIEADLRGPSGDLVLAEARLVVNREHRDSFVVEGYRAHSLEEVQETGLDATLEALPRLAWLGGLVPLYDAEESSPSLIAVFQTRRLTRLPEQVLVLCPRVADELGWRLQPGTLDRYLDAGGRPMAWTIWWRDAAPQPVDEEEFRGEGQRVCLSAEGADAVASRHGTAELRRAAWRRAEHRGNTELRFRTD